MHDIYDTLTSCKDDYNDIKRKLTYYFEPRINLTFKVYNFHQMKQGETDQLTSLLPDWNKKNNGVILMILIVK